MEQVEHDPDFIVLSRQFKATAMELISLLEQVRVGLSYFPFSPLPLPMKDIA